jgi:hypothetical protein
MTVERAAMTNDKSAEPVNAEAAAGIVEINPSGETIVVIRINRLIAAGT